MKKLFHIVYSPTHGFFERFIHRAGMGSIPTWQTSLMAPFEVTMFPNQASAEATVDDIVKYDMGVTDATILTIEVDL